PLSYPFYIFLLTLRPPPPSTLFPYTTLFRSNTVLHILAIAREAGVDFRMEHIDALSRRVPNICKVAPSAPFYVEDVHRAGGVLRSEEHTSELQSRVDLVCRLLLEKKKKKKTN